MKSKNLFIEGLLIVKLSYSLKGALKSLVRSLCTQGKGVLHPASSLLLIEKGILNLTAAFLKWEDIVLVW